MTIEHVGLIVLLVVAIVQQGFFMWQIQKLVNKTMSRDFHSYNQTLNPPKPVQPGFHIELPDGYDRVKELNQSLGM